MASPRKKTLPSVGGGDRGQNIQVFVRCRPLNETEKAARSYSVVDTPNSREITVKEKQMSSLTKTFQFDKVFGTKSKQLDVYRSVVEPLIGQVMDGYNCTVFAYGQTGTGKTFTMEGGDGRGDPNMTWETDPTSGIIPRALAQLFDELRVQQEAEFSVRVSFLELYNEEIFDLLSATDDTTRLRLYEDSARKGSVIIQGLEEVQVHNKKEVYQILEKGSEKRVTAATLMNLHSSRSHTVFTVTVHMKESSVEGEEVLRIGKLNLVDLAGSENVGRSGAVDKRAREAGNINQSLLTLGRVITCLVERTPHIPYRESKLTRLLQDSLGGRTKTSIIATVSPAQINLEETLSTLDYAHRAKDIKNKPEVNQKLSKKAVLKEYTEEIEKLRKDLMASREKNGVFLANENYQQMLTQIEIQSQEIAEKVGAIKALKEEMDKHEEMFEEVSNELQEKNAELESINTKLSEVEHNLSCTRTVLHKTATEREEQKHLVEKHVETEVKLSGQAKKLLDVSEVSSKDLKLLHDKLDRKKKIEAVNEEAKDEFSETFSSSVAELVGSMKQFGNAHEEECTELQKQLGKQLKERAEQLASLSEMFRQVVTDQETCINRMDGMLGEISKSEEEFLDKQIGEVKKVVAENSKQSEEFVKMRIHPILEKVSAILAVQSEELKQLKESVSLDVDSLVKKVNVFSSEAVENVNSLKQSVEKYGVKNEGRVEFLKSKNTEIQESEKRFKNLLDGLVKSYMEHSKLVENNTKSIESSSNEDLEEVKTLVSKSENVVGEINTKKSETMELIDTENSRITEYVTVSTVKCGEINIEIGNEKSKLENVVKNNSQMVQEKLNDFSTRTDEIVEAQTKVLDGDKNKVRELIEHSKTEKDLQVESIKQIVEETVNKDHLSVTELKESLAELESRASTQVESLSSRLRGEQETVSTFVTDVLQEDQPTGLTPARADRSFPRYLAATSPHERILNRFRAEAASVAARLPLDDSDDGDSLVSGSTVLSRQNSVGEMADKRTSAEQDGKRSGGGSQSSSRAGSRQNSSSDLKKNIFGSTSDIGSEIGDLENQDPNFRKPAATKAKGQASKARTGIKKPEMRTRGALGSANN